MSSEWKTVGADTDKRQKKSRKKQTDKNKYNAHKPLGWTAEEKKIISHLKKQSEASNRESSARLRSNCNSEYVRQNQKAEKSREGWTAEETTIYDRLNVLKSNGLAPPKKQEVYFTSSVYVGGQEPKTIVHDVVRIV